jgi:hypothetical protein
MDRDNEQSAPSCSPDAAASTAGATATSLALAVAEAEEGAPGVDSTTALLGVFLVDMKARAPCLSALLSVGSTVSQGEVEVRQRRWKCSTGQKSEVQFNTVRLRVV